MLWNAAGYLDVARTSWSKNLDNHFKSFLKRGSKYKEKVWKTQAKSFYSAIY